MYSFQWLYNFFHISVLFSFKINFPMYRDKSDLKTSYAAILINSFHKQANLNLLSFSSIFNNVICATYVSLFLIYLLTRREERRWSLTRELLHFPFASECLVKYSALGGREWEDIGDRGQESMRFYGFIALMVFFREPENILRFTRDLGIAIKYASLLFNNQNIGKQYKKRDKSFNKKEKKKKRKRESREIFRLKK